MDADGSNVKQLTHELGYDGGPFWSSDGKEDRLSRASIRRRRRKSRTTKSSRAGSDSSRQSRNLGDECRRLRQASGDAQSAPPTSRRISIPTASGSFSRPTWLDARTAAHFDLYIDQRGRHGSSSASRSIRASMRSRCSARTASTWCGHPTATAMRRTRRTSSSPTGWSRQDLRFAGPVTCTQIGEILYHPKEVKYVFS